MEESREEVSAVVQRVLAQGHVNLRTLAETSGYSYQTLRSWSNGRRTPSDREHILRLADAIESSSSRLNDLARELRDVASSLDE